MPPTSDGPRARSRSSYSDLPDGPTSGTGPRRPRARVGRDRPVRRRRELQQLRQLHRQEQHGKELIHQTSALCRRRFEDRDYLRIGAQNDHTIATASATPGTATAVGKLPRALLSDGSRRWRPRQRRYDPYRCRGRRAPITLVNSSSTQLSTPTLEKAQLVKLTYRDV